MQDEQRAGGVYYNECDGFAAGWLRQLIAAGKIADGDVDERSIVEVEPADIRGYTQCHFFAGIGVWSYALRAAGWPDDTRVWTGSCPCQSFSASGKREGFDDPRHLWPAWFRLIRECRPNICFGEQVASKDGLAWFDVVSADLEGEGYAVGAADTCAAGFGAPHIRQRLYFVADAEGAIRRLPIPERRSQQASVEFIRGRETGILADTECGPIQDSGRRPERRNGIDQSGEAGDLGHASGKRLSKRERDTGIQREAMEPKTRQATISPSLTNGFWAGAEWLWCRDGKYRPTKSGLFPLASGIANRVGTLRGAGNSLVAPQAQGFVEAYMEIHGEGRG